MMGAACGDRRLRPRSRRWRDYGAAVGLAFQVVDDILDVTADSATLGKTAGKDAAQDKPTYVSLLGLERSAAFAQRAAGAGAGGAGRQRLARHTGFTRTGHHGGEPGQ